MNPEERSLLEKVYKMTEENNAILHSIRRTTRLGLAMRILYWVVIIGLSVGALYFIQPYVDFMTGAFNKKSDSSMNSTGGVQDTIDTLQDLLK